MGSPENPQITAPPFQKGMPAPDEITVAIRRGDFEDPLAYHNKKVEGERLRQVRERAIETYGEKIGEAYFNFLEGKPEDGTDVDYVTWRERQRDRLVNEIVYGLENTFGPNNRFHAVRALVDLATEVSPYHYHKEPRF